MSKILSTMVSLTAVLASSVALAGLPSPPPSVPEPGLFGIVAVGVAAVIIAARLRNRK